MEYSVEEVKEHITTKIYNNTEFTKATIDDQTRAITEAKQQLKNFYGKRELPIEAISYQTLWLLRVDDAIKRAEQGVNSISLNGISISINSSKSYMAPEVIRILGRRIGSYRL